MSEFELVTNTRIRPRAREWIIEFIYLKKKTEERGDEEVEKQER